ncbi:MAG: hypothetical protein A4E51_01796 [Methanosaeta sp. PtaU1.Bin055]|nr:MAG: hypothetical protein A4E51_01796 [Methanosaeta sp. PtaU1.Bin055]
MADPSPRRAGPSSPGSRSAALTTSRTPKKSGAASGLSSSPAMMGARRSRQGLGPRLLGADRVMAKRSLALVAAT